MAVSLGDVLAILAFVFQAGACYMLLRTHSAEIKTLRDWKENVGVPVLGNHALRLDAIDNRLGLGPYSGD